MKKILSLSLFIACTVLCGCEYDNTDVNYIELEPPSPNHAFMLDLASVPSGEPIYVYGKTYLYYKLGNLPSSDYEIVWYLDGEVFGYNYMDDDRYYITIEPHVVSSGTHTLRMVIVSDTGTGSLAETLGMEKYVGEQTFILRVGTTDRMLNIRQEITTEGRLKIVWDKPDLKQTEVEKYVLQYTDMETFTEKQIDIAGADVMEWTSSSFVYGWGGNVTITSFFRNDKMEPWVQNFLAESPVFGSDNFITEDAGWGKVRIRMKPYPYNAVFEISIGDQINRRMTTDDFPIIVDRPLFPDRLPVSVGFIAGGGDRVQHREIVNIPYPSLPASRKIFHSTFDNVIYLDGGKRLLALDADNLETVRDIAFNDLINYNINALYSDQASARKAIWVNNNSIRLYQDGSLTSPKMIGLEFETIHDIVFAPQDRLYIFCRKVDWSTYTNRHYLFLYDANTGELQDSKVLTEYTSMNTSGQFSVDGRYMMVHNPYDMDATRFMDIYELDGTQATLVKSFTADEALRAATHSRMHPTDPSLFMLIEGDDTNSKITLMRLPSFDVVASVEGVVMETDPFTGNIFYRNQGAQGWVYTIASPTLDRTLLEYTDTEVRSTTLLNNRFFTTQYTDSVNYYDLLPYLSR